MTERDLFKEFQYLLDTKGFKFADKITTETSLRDHYRGDGLGFDSLDIVDIVFDLEVRTGKNCETDNIENFKTVGDIINFFKE